MSIAHRLRCISILLLAASHLGCTPESQNWLDDHTGLATQDEVMQRFGKPVYVARLRDGREVWTFRDRGLGYSRDMGAGFCREYILSFDERHLLRRWERQECY